MTETATFESWAIVEVMGHNRFAGFVSEHTIAGRAFIRIEVPECPPRPAFSRLLGPDSIYAIQPVAEDIARDVARTLKQAPLTDWDFTPELRNTIEAGRRLLSSSPPDSVINDDRPGPNEEIDDHDDEPAYEDDYEGEDDGPGPF